MTPDPFDTEFGAGVRTVRHAPVAAGPWIDAPTHDGVWWVWDGREVFSWTLRRLETRAGDHWSYAVNGTGSFGIGRTDDLAAGRKFAPAIPPAAPTDDAPATHFDEPPEIP